MSVGTAIVLVVVLVGLAFGGGMSYMKTVAYAHSSDPLTVFYGFFCLFVLGFIWSAPGGAGIALAAYLDREQLTRSFAPICAVFIAWYLQDATRAWYRGLTAGFIAGQEMSALLAVAAVLVARRTVATTR